MVQATVTPATGTAEREAALALVDAQAPTRRITVGGDKNYDTRQFVQDLRARQVTPHVAQHTTGRTSAIDGRTTRPDTRAMPSVNSDANGLKKSSAG